MDATVAAPKLAGACQVGAWIVLLAPAQFLTQKLRQLIES
jgi:hypothetical protein